MHGSFYDDTGLQSGSSYDMMYRKKAKSASKALKGLLQETADPSCKAHAAAAPECWVP